MISGQSVLAVVPARGGSKGISLKNLREVGGRPLVALAGDVAGRVPEIDRAVVSTDHEDIARVAEEAGLAAPFRRPVEISGDRIGDHEVLINALRVMEELDGRTYDIIVMLQPTSPLRTPEMVSGAIRMLTQGRWDSVWSVSETDSKYHPLKQLRVDGNAMDYYDPQGSTVIARQQLQPLYHRNGIVYAISRSCLVEQQSIKGRRAGAYVIGGHHVSIDTEWDLGLANYILSSRTGKPNA